MSVHNTTRTFYRYYNARCDHRCVYLGPTGAKLESNRVPAGMLTEQLIRLTTPSALEESQSHSAASFFVLEPFQSLILQARLIRSVLLRLSPIGWRPAITGWHGVSCSDRCSS